MKRDIDQMCICRYGATHPYMHTPCLHTRILFYLRQRVAFMIRGMNRTAS